MPRNNRRHQNVTAGNTPSRQITGHNSPETTQQPPQPSKTNPKFLSILLQALIMALVISLFFIFVGVAAIIFLHICIVGGAIHRRRNFRRPISANGESSSGLSLELLKTLPKTRYKGLEICAICLENVKEGENCRILSNCKHVFHVNCVDKWLVKVPVCPTCRSSVILLDSNRVNDDDDRGVVNRTAAIGWERLWAVCPLDG